MILAEETGVLLSALPIDEFKDHMRLGTGFADDGLQDGLLEGFLRAALAAVEARTSKTLLARDFSWSNERWTNECRQALPVAPISEVSAVELLDAAGTPTAVDAAVWQLVPDMQRPVVAALNGALPAPVSGGSVRISFTAGYGPTWGDLPADLCHAVILLAAHYYEFRHETALGSGCMPFGVTALIERYRSVRLLGAGA
ncbi:MAG: hypothetical protein JKX69_15900 [Rhodobacteraceae bacterium]|nr:hypothetical protein [Paracoccaceae bacterium]